MPVWTNIQFYNTNPFNWFGTTTGATVTYGGPSTTEGVATITDNESGIEGNTLDDDSAGGETATADVTIGGVTSTGSTVDAEYVWTLRDTVTGQEFQVVQFQVEQGNAAGNYTLSEVPLVNGRQYEVVEINSNPNAAAGSIAFNYAEHQAFFGGATPDGTVDGTAGNDVIDAGYVDPDADMVSAGDDIVLAGAGDDVVEAGRGNDSIDGGTGSDTLFGGGGGDTIAGGAGTDTLYGGTGSDTLDGGDEADTVFGGLGDDTITDTGGADVIDGGLGNDTIDAGADADVVDGGLGDDSIQGGAGNDTITGDGGVADVSGSGGTGTSPDAGSLLLDVANVRAGSETGTPGDAQVGDSVIYDNAATLPDGTVVSVRVTLTGKTDPNLGVDLTFDGSPGSVLLINAANDPAMDGETASFSFEFLDQATGQPLTLSGSATIADIDQNTTGEQVILDANTFSSFSTSQDTSLIVEQVGDQIVATGTEGNTPQDEDAWLSGSFTDQSVLNVTLGGAASTAGFGFSGQDITNPSVTAVSADDKIDGGAGDDTILGEAGDDSIAGGLGADSIDGGSGDDLIYGGVDGEAGTANLIVNGSFEDLTGTTATSYGAVAPGAVTGWTDVNGTSLDLHSDGKGNTFATDGTYTMDMGSSPTNNHIVQDVQNVVDGADYTLSFDAGDLDTLDNNAIEVYWGGQLVATVDPAAGTMESFSFTVQGGAGDGSNRLEFVEIGPEDPHGVQIDNVQLVGPDASFTGTDASADTLSGGDGADQIHGQDGDDSLSGDAGTDTLYGGAGADTLDGGADADTVFGGAGADSATGGAGDDAIFGGAGNDTLTGGTGDDTVDGGDDADRILIDAASGSDTITGGEGDTGGGDFDVLDATGEATDATVVFSAPEAGTVSYGGVTHSFSEIERVELGAGADSVTGSAGADDVDLGLGADTIDAGAGNDTIGLGDDGAGAQGDGAADLVVLADGFGDDLIRGLDAPTPNGDGTFTGIDTFDATGLTITTSTGTRPVTTNDITVGDDGSGNALLTFPSGDSVVLEGISPADAANPFYLNALGFPLPDGTVEGTSGADIIDGSYEDPNDGDTPDAGDAILPGAAPDDDLILAYGGNDQVFAGDGADSVDAGSGADTVYGGAGDDSLFGNSGDDLIYGGTGNDWIDTGINRDTAFGGDGDDTLMNGSTGGAQATLYGDAGNDTLLTGTGGANDELYGGTGDDTLTDRADSTSDGIFDGGAGNDTITAAGGDDTIVTGTGADTAFGGDGADTITFSEGDSAYGGAGDDLFVLEDLGETTNGTITIDGGSEDGADTLQLGTLANLTQAVRDTFVDDGTGSFSGTITLDDGTILNFTEIENIICFTPGTRIATPRGARPIEELKVGDIVVTRDHGLQPIRWIGSRTVPAYGRFAPVRIRAGVCTGQETDLVVSPQHRMLFQGYRAELLFGESEVLVAAAHLVDDHAVTQEEGGTVTYIHMMFDAHEIVYAEGAATESFHPGEVGLSAVSEPAREELFALFPVLRADPSVYGRAARRCLKKHEARLIL